MPIPPPVICCAARVCCDDQGEAIEALSTAIHDNQPQSKGAGGLSKGECNNLAAWILDNFDLAPKGSLEKLINAYRPLFKLAQGKLSTIREADL